MVHEQGDSILHGCVENVITELVQPPELIQPPELPGVPEGDVMGNMVTDEPLEHRILQDHQWSFRPDRFDRLITESFVLRGVADEVRRLAGAIEGVAIEVTVPESPIGDDDVSPVGELDLEVPGVG